MKTKFFSVMTVIAAAALLIGATVWEGVTDVAFSKDLPRAYSVATNSFPRNTVVDITNLENGKMVRVIVISGLETTGLLATLSQNAADALDLRHDSTCRIRMSQSTDNITRVRGAPAPQLPLGPIDSSGAAPATETATTRTATMESAPAAAAKAPAAEDTTPAARTAAANDAPAASKPAATETVTTTKTTTTETITTTTRPVAATEAPTTTKAPAAESAPAAAAKAPAAESAPAAAAKAPAAENITPSSKPAAAVSIIAVEELDAADEPAVTDNVTAAVSPAGAVEKQPEPRIASGTLVMLPAEERVPAAQDYPAAASANAASDEVAPNIVFSDTAPPAEAAYTPPGEFSPFQAPLISSLAPGKWYVQLGVYSRPDNVEDEISRIGTSYPVAVQNIGTDTSPMFRVLLGPLNQGESGAMLQRFKSIGYNDAFVRHN